MKWFHSDFQGWITERLLVRSGIITYSSDLDHFLHSPIQYLPIQNPLKRSILVVPVETMNELLTQYSIRDLKRYRGFGSKKVEGFKSLLKENNCLIFLREK